MAAHAPARKSVLLVEDDEETGAAKVAVLQDAGYHVTLAGDGEEALGLLSQEPLPDLILLDMLMPGMDGWHFLQHIKAKPNLRTVPIVIVTGTILTLEWAHAHGCCGILHKPIDPEALLREVRRCVA